MTRILLSFAALTLTLAAAKPLHAQAAVQGVNDVAISAADRQKFVGLYNMRNPSSGEAMGTFRVFEKDGVLLGDINGHHTATLLYQGDNVFRPKEDPTYTVTFRMEKDGAAAVVVQGSNERIEGVRSASR